MVFRAASNGLSLYQETLQALSVPTKELLGYENPPLNYVDEFMKVDRLILYLQILIILYEKGVQIRDAVRSEPSLKSAKQVSPHDDSGGIRDLID